MGMSAVARMVVAMLSLLALCAVSVAERRVALVIGNSAYAHASVLANPLNDAADVADAFERLGFAVTRLENADKRAMELGLLEFSEAAFRSDVAVVFYAGHGIEVDGENYLVPVDARLKTDRAVTLETVPFYQVRKMQPKGGLLLVILDACRDNPFAQTMRRTGATRTVGARGLGRIDLETSGVGGTLVAYAAAAGAVARDGAGRNSPYTAALLAHLEVPGVEVGDMFRKVRAAVFEKTGKEQAPAVYGSRSDKDVYLAGRKPEEPEKVEPANPPGAGGVIRVQGEAREAFDTAKDLDTIEAYQKVIDHFRGYYADLARQRIRELERQRIKKLEEELDKKLEEKLEEERERRRIKKLEEELERRRAKELEEERERRRIRELKEEREKKLALDEKKLALDRRARREFQSCLKTLGFDPGEPDGLFGPRTRAAVRAWQAARGVKATGFFSRDDADALLTAWACYAVAPPAPAPPAPAPPAPAPPAPAPPAPAPPAPAPPAPAPDGRDQNHKRDSPGWASAPFDPVLNFKMPVLRSPHGPSLAQTSCMVRNRLSWMRFCGFGPGARVPEWIVQSPGGQFYRSEGAAVHVNLVRGLEVMPSDRLGGVLEWLSKAPRNGSYRT